MKQSDYNIFLPEQNNVLCFNSYSDSYLIISKSSYRELLAGDLHEFSADNPNTYDALVQSGFIIPDDVDQLAMLRTENKKEMFASDTDYLMVYPTQDCNLKCWYCYETHVPGSKMTKEVLERTKSYISKLCQSSKAKTLRMTFFGGEPFLYYKDIVKPLLRHTYESCLKSKKAFVPFFVTNASLLNKKTIDEIMPFNPVFQITLDGWKNKHDSVRKWKSNGLGTYDHIIEVIDQICKKEQERNTVGRNVITVRINYDDETLNDMVEIIRDFEGIDKKLVFFQLERVWQTMGSINEKRIEQLKKALLQLTLDGYSVGHGLFGIKRVACPAEIYHYAVINWDGNIYKCNGRTLSEPNKEGVLLADGTIRWNEKKQAKRVALSTFENKMCLNCKMLPQCLGPCSQKIQECNGNLEDICSLKYADMPLSEYIRTNFEMKIIRKRNETR